MRCYSKSNDHSSYVLVWDTHIGSNPIWEKMIPCFGNYGLSNPRFSPDNRFIAFINDPQGMYLVSAESGQTVLGPVRGYWWDHRCFAWSPDSARLTVGYWAGAIRIWDVSNIPQSHTVATGASMIELSDTQNDPPVWESEWKLQGDGWIIDRASRLLAWVPLDLKESVLYPRNIHLFSTKGYVKINFENALIGERWSECYTPAD
ncbi:unnamed protein product [Rhizoctonia solani]|uniref:Vegetative incompatibility protein HET-E-1 [Podospora anserina] n=1 Tax=Rhizoctonia solani TaxID=456999 RepID=A0A8H3GRX3_9AGAM|nr:unnamed protein product [Rhizoctonia solani]